jgi:hypothetical protein
MESGQVWQEAKLSAWLKVLQTIKEKIQDHFGKGFSVRLQYYNPYYKEVMMPYEEPIYYIELVWQVPRFLGLFPKTETRELCRFPAEGIEKLGQKYCGIYDKDILPIVMDELIRFGEKFRVAFKVAEEFQN